MSVARGFGINGKSYYTNVCGPRDVNLQFTVASTNSAGLGVTSVKANGFVEYVFMHTTQTPGSVNGFTNPNPASGYAIVKFKNNFNVYLNNYFSQIVPTASNSTTSLTSGNVYVITAVGNTTLANWQAVGLQKGLTPTVGQAFVATATTSITGSGTVGLPGVPTINSISAIGDPNQSIANSSIASNAGAIVVVQFSALSPAGTISAPTFTGSALANHTHTLNLKNAAVSDGATTRVNAGSNLLGANTGSDITIAGAGANGGIANASAGTPAGTISAPTFTSSSAFAATAPADSTIIMMKFSFDGSSVTVDGL